MIAAVGHISLLDPAACRRHVQNHFSTSSMAGKYLELYQRTINKRRHRYTEVRTGTEFPEALQPVLAGGKAS
jgi:hypothetical protein